MYARITNSLLYNNLQQALNQTEQSQNQALTEVETGRQVNSPSDDPVAAALASANTSQAAQATQYLQNINTINGELQVGDSALSQAVTTLNQAISVGTEGANGGLSDAQRSDVAQQIGQIQQEMIGIANTTYNGAYIFGGTATGSPPYAADASQPDGVQYSGNTQTNQVEVAPGASVTLNVPGSQIFQNSSGSVFQALQDLQTALQSNDSGAAQTAVTELGQSLTTLSQQRVFYGSTSDQLTSESNFLNNEQMNLTQEQTTLVGANLASAITDLSQAETARQAILSAGAQISNTSLLNYLGTTGG
ncbi:MAG: flagellar hook-associated protein FlgL [Terriglobales bacterium]